MPAKVEVVTGARASGKTEALVGRVCEMLSSGIAATDILVVAPGADAANELRVRICSMLGQDASPRVVAWRGLIYELAGLPRVLSQPEQSVLLADMRAQGFSAQEVAQALDVARHAWERGERPGGCATAPFSRPGSQGAVQDGSSSAEVLCARALLGMLGARGATVPEALLALAHERVGQTPCVAHVLVDDAGLLPARALRLLVGVAFQTCVLAGDPGLADKVAAFAEPGDIRELPMPVKRVHARRAQAVKWLDASEEACGIAALVDHAFDEMAAHARAGLASGRDVSACLGPVVVVAPNRAWAKRAGQALAHAGIEVRDVSGTSPLACDPRDPKGCVPLRCQAALGLLANQQDAASWRAWLSLGYADLSCRAWQGLEAHIAGSKDAVELSDVLFCLADEVDKGRAPFVGARQAAARVREAQALFRACTDKRGAALLDAVDPAKTPAFRRLFAVAEDDLAHMGASELFAVLQQGVVDPALGVLPSEVRGARVGQEVAAVFCRQAFVCLPGELAGLYSHLLVVVGANAGLIEPGLLGDVLAMQADELVVSYIQRMPVEAARRLGATWRRTRREAAGEMALLQPSEALEALACEAPATMGGQQYCSAVLGVRP